MRSAGKGDSSELCLTSTAATHGDIAMRLAVVATYICGAQEEHHPAASTSFPGKIWQGPRAEPPAP